MSATPFRIGHGFDLHRLVPGRPCILGGVEIPSELGPDGHSDADVLLHALIDALLGACALGDIGEHFPDSDPRYRGADSRDLLRQTLAKVQDAGFAVVNVDCTVISETPRLSKHKEAMAQSVAGLLGLERGAVNIKAKTHEGVDAIGERRAIASHVVVLVSFSS